MKLRFHKTASKELSRLHPSDARRISQKLRLLQADGLKAPLDIKRLTNSEDYRLRVGGIRVIFHVDGDEILILAIRPRGKAYRP